MSSYEGYRRCPRCGYGHAWESYDNHSGREEFSCGGCGHLEGWESLDAMGRRERRAATGERFDRDGTGEVILARYQQTGHGVARIQLVDGQTRRHHFRRPLTDRGSARLRRLLEADPRIDADACWITRWNGHTLEVLHGTLPPGGYDYAAAAAASDTGTRPRRSGTDDGAGGSMTDVRFADVHERFAQGEAQGTATAGGKKPNAREPRAGDDRTDRRFTTGDLARVLRVPNPLSHRWLLRGQLFKFAGAEKLEVSSDEEGCLVARTNSRLGEEDFATLVRSDGKDDLSPRDYLLMNELFDLVQRHQDLLNEFAVLVSYVPAEELGRLLATVDTVDPFTSPGAAFSHNIEVSILGLNGGHTLSKFMTFLLAVREQYQCFVAEREVELEGPGA